MRQPSFELALSSQNLLADDLLQLVGSRLLVDFRAAVDNLLEVWPAIEGALVNLPVGRVDQPTVAARTAKAIAMQHGAARQDALGHVYGLAAPRARLATATKCFMASGGLRTPCRCHVGRVCSRGRRPLWIRCHGWLLLGLQGRDAVRERLYKDQHAVGEHALISQLAAQLRDRGV